MALSKVDYNSINVTAAASKALKWNSSANGFETGDVGGSLVLLDTFTSDGSDDTATFASSIDSTYKEYLFVWTDIHPETNDTDFTVNFRDGSTAYDATKTTTYFSATHSEDGTGGGLSYETAVDLAQATGVQKLSKSGMGNDNDHSCSGLLHLYDPSNTTFVKHFAARNHYSGHDEQSRDEYIAGYCNTTSAIDGVQFKFVSDEIQAGVIKMYGVL